MKHPTALGISNAALAKEPPAPKMTAHEIRNGLMDRERLRHELGDANRVIEDAARLHPTAFLRIHRAFLVARPRDLLRSVRS